MVAVLWLLIWLVRFGLRVSLLLADVCCFVWLYELLTMLASCFIDCCLFWTCCVVGSCGDWLVWLTVVSSVAAFSLLRCFAFLVIGCA